MPKSEKKTVLNKTQFKKTKLSAKSTEVKVVKPKKMSAKAKVNLYHDLMYQLYMEGDVDKVKKYLEDGFDPNLDNIDNEEAMDIFSKGDWENLSSSDDCGLFWHIENGGSLLSLTIDTRFIDHDVRIKMVELLIKHGARLEQKLNHHKETILMNAVSISLDMVKLLVENGANVNAVDKDGLSVLNYAFETEHLDIVKYLMSKGSKIQSAIELEKLHNSCEKEGEVGDYATRLYMNLTGHDEFVI